MMSDSLSRSALRVQRALEAAGMDSRVVELPDTTRSAREAELAGATGGTVGWRKGTVRKDRT